MDPISATAGIVGLLEVVTKLSSSVYRIKQDYKSADEDLDIAQKQVALLREEIHLLESRNASFTRIEKSNGQTSPGSTIDKGEGSFTKALATARELLISIEDSSPLSTEPNNWKRRFKWAMNDKQLFNEFKERLKAAEGTLRAIVAVEQW